MPRQRYILILAANTAEANTYAKRSELPRFTYRAVEKASSIRNIKVADVHILPSFYQRRDQHAILAELRWGHDIKRFDVEMPPAPEEPVVDQGDGMGQQLTIEDALEPVAYDGMGAPLYEHQVGRRHKSVDPQIEIVAESVPDEKPKPVKRPPKPKRTAAPTANELARIF